MALIHRYILSVISAAMICGILLGISKNSFYHRYMKLLCGLFMSITFLSPLITLRIPDWEQWDFDIHTQAEAYVSEGVQIGLDATADVIKAQCETYILTKAASLDIPISVQISLSEADPPIPESAVLWGTDDPLQRNTIGIILENDLGITKEHQTWKESD